MTARRAVQVLERAAEVLGLGPSARRQWASLAELALAAAGELQDPAAGEVPVDHTTPIEVTDLDASLDAARTQGLAVADRRGRWTTTGIWTEAKVVLRLDDSVLAIDGPAKTLVERLADVEATEAEAAGERAQWEDDVADALASGLDPADLDLTSDEIVLLRRRSRGRRGGAGRR